MSVGVSLADTVELVLAHILLTVAASAGGLPADTGELVWSQILLPVPGTLSIAASVWDDYELDGNHWGDPFMCFHNQHHSYWGQNCITISFDAIIPIIVRVLIRIFIIVFYVLPDFICIYVVPISRLLIPLKFVHFCCS